MYACDYSPDGSFATWLPGTTDWAMLTYRDGMTGPVHWTPDGAEYFRQHGQPAPAVTVINAGVASAVLPDPTEVSFQDPGVIPDEFCGTWERHGEQVKIYCLATNPELVDPAVANMVVTSRVYAWCADPRTGKPTGQQPCDVVRGNELFPGGLSSLRVEQSTDPDATSLIATFGLDNSPLHRRGQTEVLTLAPGPMLAVDGQPTYCNENTDPAVGSLWCGA